MAPLLEDADSWRLLAQFASDDTLGRQWADGGVLYFMIYENDLAALRFDNVCMVLQSNRACSSPQLSLGATAAARPAVD